MLTAIRIKDFAIIEDQTINFADGLNIISGETGSGKSLVLQALEILLGKKPKSDVYRKGTEGWEIEAHFDLSQISENLLKKLPEIAQEDELVLSRRQTKAGRGKVFINGRTGTLSLLKEISQNLINICGQGYHSKLLDGKYHLDLLDEYSGVHKLYQSYRESFAEYTALKKEYLDLLKAQEDKERRTAELQFVIEELSDKGIKAGLREEYETFIKTCDSQKEILANISQVKQILNHSSGVFTQLLQIQKNLTKLSKLSEGFEDLNEFVVSADSSLQDFEKSLNNLSSTDSFSSAALEETKTAFSELARLERKFRTNDEGLTKLLIDATSELENLEGTEKLSELKAKLEELRLETTKRARKLSKKRKESSKKLKVEVEKELTELSMKDAELGLEFSEKDLSADGSDIFEFYISTNKGEEKKKLGSVASGGELSRVMLVLKKVLRDHSGVNILIFDEIDTGVSGSVARAIGEKLKAIAASCQVVCITHLAQVASLGRRHLLIEKVSGKRTQTIVREIVGDEQLEEIARMISGHKVTEASKSTAKELLGW